MADLCAAPGSKTLQLLDLMNMGRSSGLTLIAKIKLTRSSLCCSNENCD